MSDYSPLLRSRFRSANIPVPYAGSYLSEVAEGVQVVSYLLKHQEPDNAVQTFVAYVQTGRIVRAEGQPTSCGKGLWITGPESTLVAAALLQELLISEAIESAFFVDAFEYTESRKPDRDALYEDRIYSDLLVLTEVSRLTEWARGLVYQLTRERYWRGLPTVVADHAPILKDAVFAGAVTPVVLREV